MNVLPGILVIGLGLGFTFVPMTLIATTNVAATDAGLASGLLNTSQQVGGALGLAILSTIAANRTASEPATAPTGAAHALVSGYDLGFLAGAGLIALGVVVAVTLLRNRDLTAIDAQAPMPALQPEES